jgi:hypothetical protein
MKMDNNRNAIEDQIFVMYKDPDGLCRAWAGGPARDRLEILKLADKHLALYRDEKASHDDPLAWAVYTREEEIFSKEVSA